MKKSLIFLLTIFVGTILAGTAVGEQLKLSMLPRFSADEINKRIMPLAKYISEEIGQPVEAVLTRDFAQYEQKAKAGEIQIAYSNPYIYALISDTHEVLATSVKGQDGEKLRGVIITRADSDIVSLEDLKNRKISIVGKTAAGGFLSQKLTLQQVGIDVEKECQLVEAVDNKQENVILAVYMGEVAAGFIRESALKQVDKFIPVDQIKVINRSAWLPNWALSVKKTLPDNVKKSILTALLNLTPKSPVLQALQIDSFRVAVDDEYDGIRKAAGLPMPKRSY